MEYLTTPPAKLSKEQVEECIAKIKAKIEEGKQTPPPQNLTAEQKKEIMAKIRLTYTRLSPEIISCDGECTRAEIRRKACWYNNQLKEYFKQLGREVSEPEAYSTHDF